MPTEGEWQTTRTPPHGRRAVERPAWRARGRRTGGDDWTAEDVLADTADGSSDASDPSEPAPIPDPSTWLPALEGRSPTPGICPFLRSVDADDVIGFPVESPDVANRCAALREPVPQSLRQQELVCLTASHINCPRYLRGALVASDATSKRRLSPVLTPAITVALAVLVLSFGVVGRVRRRQRWADLAGRGGRGERRADGNGDCGRAVRQSGHDRDARPVRRRVGGCGLAGAAIDIAGPDASARGSHARADTQAHEDAEAEAQLEPLRPPHALPERA